METLHIFGMGSAGRFVAEHISRFFPTVRNVWCYDDDSALIGRAIHGFTVRGPIEDAISRYHFSTSDTALFAMPSAAKSRIASLFYLLKEKHCDSICIIPGSTPVIEGTVYQHTIRPIKPEDVIGRPYVPLRLHSCKENAKTSTVLITGAGGSLGRELALQCLWLSFSVIYLLGHGETSIVRVFRELKELQRDGLSPHTTIIPLILDLQNAPSLQRSLAPLRLDYIINTAAHKHVFLMEENPYAAFSNNVAGLVNLFDAVEKHSLKALLQVSTDKAVNPRSVYGVTKMMAEELSTHSPLPVIIVRFGNILASRGSLAEVVKHHSPAQPLQLSDPNSQRYYMSVSEAASLILRLLFEGTGHTMYGLDMGEPIRLKRMVADLLRFYFPRVHDSIQISYSKLSDAEKFSEQLLGKNEVSAKTTIPRVFSIRRSSKGSPPDTAYYSRLREELLDHLERPDFCFSELQKHFSAVRHSQSSHTKEKPAIAMAHYSSDT